MKKLLYLALLSLFALPLQGQNFGGTGGVRLQGAFAVNDCVKIVNKTAVTSAGSACGAAAGTVTTTGSPASGQGAFMSGASTITSLSTWTTDGVDMTLSSANANLTIRGTGANVLSVGPLESTLATDLIGFNGGGEVLVTAKQSTTTNAVVIESETDASDFQTSAIGIAVAKFVLGTSDPVGGSFTAISQPGNGNTTDASVGLTTYAQHNFFGATATGTTTALTGLLVGSNANYNGTVTNSYGIRINDQGGSGSIATALKIDAQTSSGIAIQVDSGNVNIGKAGTATGALRLTGTTSGVAILTAQAAAGTPTLTLGTTTGTLAGSATAPLAINAITGVISVTGAAGQVLAGATPAFTATPTLGVAGTTVGTLSFENATSGSIKFSPTTGALSTTTITLPAFTGTAVVAATSTTTTQALFATATAGAPAFRALAAADLPVATSSAVGGVIPRDNLSMSGSNLDFNPLDLTNAWIREDFFAGTITTGQIGQYGWITAAVGAAITAGGVQGDFPNIGQYKITTTAVTTQGGWLLLGNSSGPIECCGKLLNTSQTWDSYFVFNPGASITGVSYRVGYVPAGISTEIPVNGAYVRFDDSLGTPDTAYTPCVSVASVETCGTAFSTAPVASTFVKARIRGTGTATIGISLYNAAGTLVDAEQTFCASGGGCTVSVTLATNTRMSPAFGVVSHTVTTARLMNIDAYGFVARGMSR